MKNAPMIALASISLLAGCAGSSNDSIKGLSQDDADRLNSGRSHFDGAKDPAFTPATRFAAGQLAESQGAPQAAVEQYKEALRLDPKHQPSLYRLGVLYTQVKLYPTAIETWKKYVEVTNGSAAAYGNLGFCYELSGREGDAEAAYQQGVARDPKNVSCRVNYGLMLVRRKRLQEGLTQLEAVLTPGQARYNVASVYEQQGKTTQAREAYAKALELDPTMDAARVRLAALNKPPATSPVSSSR